MSAPGSEEPARYYCAGASRIPCICRPDRSARAGLIAAQDPFLPILAGCIIFGHGRALVLLLGRAEDSSSVHGSREVRPHMVCRIPCICRPGDWFRCRPRRCTKPVFPSLRPHQRISVMPRSPVFELIGLLMPGAAKSQMPRIISP